MFKPTAIKIATLGAVLAPSIAFAQNFTQVNNILAGIKNILNVLVPILITLAVIYFIWGVISYVIAKDEEARKESRDKMIYGIIGLFVIIAIWGLVAFLANTLGVGVEGNVNAPCVGDTNPYIDGCQS